MNRTLELQLIPKVEREKRIRFEVATINQRFGTIAEFRERVSTLKAAGGMSDTVLAPEFSMNILDVIEGIEELKVLALESNIDIIAAPGQRSVLERETWGEIKALLKTANVLVEESTFPDEGVPDSVGIFIGKNGQVFAFPKSFGNLDTGTCVHRVPETGIGVTICGEINHIKPRELEGITVLYNPAEEYDDPDVWIRMVQQAKGRLLTRDEVRELLLKDPALQMYMLDDSEYRTLRQMHDDSLRSQIGDDKFSQLFGGDLLIEEDETPEKRRDQFDRIVDAMIIRLKDTDYDSMYVKNAPGVSEALRERRIPVIRADGMKTSGVLNTFDGMKIETVKIGPESTRISLSV